MLWSPKSLNPRVIFRKSKLTELWRKRKISNFEYLMALNRMAGRSFNDLTQYPVFPWILADFQSEKIDLTDSRVYRDLSKPVGALNPDRLAQLLERYGELELFGFTEAEKFLFGSHYSSPGIVLHFLIRLEPFTSMAIDLQSGRFDCPDRLFFDIADCWNGCLTSTSDMKELIPEFFCLPEMFLNTNKFPLGRTQSGRLVDDVALPPWANGSAYEFVRIHRLALESEFVSQNLHHWIDLIFGYKQRGEASIAAHNVFHHLSYEGSVDLDKITDEVDRNAAESHIQNFGQTPSQLMSKDPHPRRYNVEQCWSPLIRNGAVARNLSCHTPSKQFANRRSEYARGAVMKLHVFSDAVLAIYADMSIGSYHWAHGSKSNRLRADKLRPMVRRELSTSRIAMKRGSAVSPEQMEGSSLAIGNWSFAVTLGGHAKEDLRRSAVVSSGRLISTNETSLVTAEASALVVSCGYWDETVKAHSIDGSRLVASETGGHNGAIRCVTVGQDGALMVTGGQDATVRVWVVEHPDMAAALSDGYVQTALGGSNGGEQTLSCCHVLWGHENPIVCVGMDSSSDVVVSGSDCGLICVHTLRRGEFVRSFRPPSLSNRVPAGSVMKAAVGTEGHVVLHMEDQGLHSYTVNAVRLCSVDAGERLHDMQICSNDEILVTGGDRCHVLVRLLSSNNLQPCSMLDLTRHGPIRCLTLTPTDLNPIPQFLFIGSDDGMITIVEQDHQHASHQNDTATTAF
jgi:Beige/BEACH domain/WD domain, G-beta repeat